MGCKLKVEEGASQIMEDVIFWKDRKRVKDLRQGSTVYVVLVVSCGWLLICTEHKLVS